MWGNSLIAVLIAHPHKTQGCFSAWLKFKNVATSRADYDWCDRCLTACEEAKTGLIYQYNFLIRLVAVSVIMVIVTVAFGLLTLWIKASFSLVIAIVFGIGSWQQWKQYKCEEQAFNGKGQHVEAVREVLHILLRSGKISLSQYDDLRKRVGQLPIFPVLGQTDE